MIKLVDVLNEVLGYKLSSRDKKMIDLFVKGYFRDASALENPNTLYVNKTSSGWELKGYSAYAAWDNGKLYYGDSFGNLSQTIINYVIKSAKVNKIDISYKKLQ